MTNKESFNSSEKKDIIDSSVDINYLITLKKEIKSFKINCIENNDFDTLNEIKNIEKLLKDKIYELKNKSIIKSELKLNIQQKNYDNKISITYFIQSELQSYFSNMGFKFMPSNDIENKDTVFESLNIDINHPSRSEKETFYPIDFPDLVLRPHTTGTDINIIKKNKYGKFFTSGLVYRRDSDKNHLPAFHQFEILSIGENVSVIELKKIVIDAISFIFHRFSILMCVQCVLPETRFRSHFFPYTSPSYELDIRCFCSTLKENSCNFCSNGWLEILGCGLISENIFKSKCIAAGFGISRLALIIKNYFSEKKEYNINSFISTQ